MPIYRICRLQLVNDATGTHYKLMFTGQEFPTRALAENFILSPQNPFGATEQVILEVFVPGH